MDTTLYTQDTLQDEIVESPDTYETEDSTLPVDSDSVEITDDTTILDGPDTTPAETTGILSETETIETTGVADDDYTPGVHNFGENLPLMGKGMLAIFAVILVIMGATALLNKIFKK